MFFKNWRNSLDRQNRENGELIKMITLQHLHDSWRESYLKCNSLLWVQENIEEVKKLGVVISESGRGLGVIHTQLSEIITLRFITLRLARPCLFDDLNVYRSPLSNDVRLLYRITPTDVIV